MKQLRFLSAILIIQILTGCAMIDHQTFVHVQNWPSQSPVGPKQLAVFMDGTGNDVETRTNVRRLFEMTVSRHRPDILAYYDPGVGTGKSVVYRFLGGPFGYGFQRNLRDALVFLTEHYRPGDEISIFGFSRGAYSAGVLATLVSSLGIPDLPPVDGGESVAARHRRAEEAVETYYREVHRAELRAEKAAKPAAEKDGALAPEERAQAWRTAYWNALEKVPNSGASAPRTYPEIAVLGLWDPVDSLVGGLYPAAKIAWSVSDVSEFGRHKGHRFHPYVLGSKINLCLMALSLDEQRQPFIVELPDSRLGMPKSYEVVWFAGDHSDVGGGHEGDKDLAGFSMNWMLSRVGDRLLGPGGNAIRVHEDIDAARHDLSVSKLYHRAAYRVRGEILGPLAQRIAPDPARKIRFTPADAGHLVPVRFEGWGMSIHGSVIARMASLKDRFYAPEKEAFLVDLASVDLDDSFARERNPRGGYIPRPFRTLPAVRASSQSWASHNWTAEEIFSKYKIVSTP